MYINDVEYFKMSFYNDKANTGELKNGKYVKHSEYEIKNRLNNQYNDLKISGKKFIEKMNELISNGNWSNEISATNHYNDFIKCWYLKHKKKNIEVVTLEYDGSKTEFNNDDIIDILKSKNIKIKEYEKYIKDGSLLIMITNGSHYNVIYNKEFIKNNRKKLN